MEWVSLEELLPLVEQRCLYTDGKLVCLGKWYEYQDNPKEGEFENQEAYWSINDDKLFSKATHWMPLPEPPKE